MKTIQDQNFANQKVLVRCDFNVPLNKETREITDDTRIRESLPTIKKLLADGAAVILMSHLGRPSETGFEEKFSLKPVAEHLSQLLGINVKLAEDIFEGKTIENAKSSKPGEVLLLENLRFLPGEQKGDVAFAKYLADLGDSYVNDAFGTAHRAHASTAVIAQFFPDKKYFGFLLANEIKNLEKLLHYAEKPFTAIIGGSKISSKIDILKNLIPRVDNIIIGGGMGYTFIKAMGGEIGLSICEDDKLDFARDIMKEMEEKGVKFYLPIDAVCGDKFDNNANIKVFPSNAIPSDWEGMDAGPESIKIFENVILSSKTILWNGPLGVFEFENFGHGTTAIAKTVAAATKNGAFSAVGGGDSISAINQNKLADQMSYISTGGGAMLEYLEGKTLPGIAAILN
ncbi:MAG: phosphoglycerate kinase [Bacteroidales bacterium]|jgi:phosphoglycerate kinase|nr:phosphoglycerate kinase [Bacteroidales bacterium]